MVTPRYFLIALLFSLPLAAQQQPDEISILRERVAAQQKQIEELRATLAEQQKLLEALARKQAVASQPAPPAAPASKPAVELARTAPDAKPYGPLSFHIGAADFTPGGFVDFTALYRSTTVGSGISTSFATLPFSSTSAGKLSETRFSSQRSRMSLKMSANMGKQIVTAYIESDFQGNPPASLSVSNNAGSMRLRHYFLQINRGKWELLGGQAWSLLTPNRVGISPMSADIFNSLSNDPSYQVGIVWTRNPQFRAVYHASRNWTAGFSVENPEQFTGPAVTLPPAYTGLFDNGSNNAIPNLHPDFVAKIAYDGKLGSRAAHFETSGLFRSFRTTQDTAHGYGGSLNGNVEIVKNIRAFLNTYWSNGGGRYIAGLGPDAIIRPNGSVSPVHSAAGVTGLEFQPSANRVFYAYYGGVYFSRNFSLTAPGQFVGFGFPGSTNANRQIQNATFGYTHTFWRNPNFGALQLTNQYAYLVRAPWSVAAGTPTTAHAHVVYIDLRYLLP